MFHYFLLDQTGILRIGYLQSPDKATARKTLEQAKIRELLGLMELPQEAVPMGARYMYPFEGSRQNKAVRGTVEGETVLSALQHLQQIFDGEIDYISERSPSTDQERALFTAQTKAILASLAPVKPTKAAALPDIASNPSAVATVLDRQFSDLLQNIRLRTQELLRERQFAEEVQEMHKTIFSLEQQHDSLKDKYDALSYLLREISYIEDGLDPSPLKKDMRVLIDKVVDLLKKVEKSMVRTAFHMDNTRVEEQPESIEDVMNEEQELPELALSRYASRKRLVSEVMTGIRALQSGQTMSMTGGGTSSVSIDLPGEPMPEHADVHIHASEPAFHMLVRELPLLLEWFCGFSVVIVIAGQIVSLMNTPLVVGGYDLQALLRPFAWQHVFLKTTLLATLALIALRAYEAFSSLWRWLTLVLVSIAAAFVLLAL